MRERVNARDGGTERRYLLFRVGVVDFAVAHHTVAGILPDPALLPLPAGADGVTGILPHAVTPRYAVDLRVKFSLRPSAGVPTAIMLDRYPAVLLVDAVLDSATIAEVAIRPVRPRPGQVYRKYALEVWRGRSRPCFLLDLEAVLGGSRVLTTQSPAEGPLARHFVPRQP